ncbi:hypothetical protein GCM10011362_14180 [Marinobacter halophilus]|nr:hypothetical protein GCM10011362_14180 [Marinobacter halophilus]
MIEGGWDQYTDQELASYCSKGSNPARLRDQLASGELVLLTESPSVPIFKLASGSLAPAGSASITIAENAVSAFETRFGARAFPLRAAGYSHTDSLPPSPKLDYTPEPPVVDWPPEPLPPPVVISENFALPPLGPKVFAKSCTRPSGDTSSNEGQEKASNFGTLAVFAPATITSPGANGLRPLSLLSGSAMRLTNGWAMAARLGASILGTAASTALLALWPSKLGDGTLYTKDELLEMAEAAIRVRFHLHVDATGSLRVAGYHVNDSTGYGDRVPVAHAQRVGENFEAVVDDGFTLVWYPDESGHRPVVSTEYPADSGIDPYNILVTPIQEDGQEHSPPGYQRPFEDQVELIVSFPADSGIEPLYLVFQKRAGVEGEGDSSNSETTFSRIVPGGGLQTHENANGHLLHKHVGQSEQALMKRLAAETRISGSSSFYNRATAENAVSQVLEANQTKITDWLEGSGGRLPLDHTLTDPAGLSVTRGSANAVAVNSARVILVRDSSMPTGYKILTGYPTKP